MLGLGYAEWGRPELKAAILASLFPADARASAAELARLFFAMGYGPTLVPVNLGRTALELALMAQARLKPGRDEVIVPDYVCPSVVNIVRKLGLKPVPSTVDASDLNLQPSEVKRQLGSHTLAVIAVSMYGVPVRAREIGYSCAAAGAIMIDDAAHVVGVKGEGGMLGCNGDAGLLSFNQSKTLTGGSLEGGGLLILTNPELRREVDKLVADLAPSRGRLRDIGSFVVHHLCDVASYPPEVYLGRLQSRLGLGGSPRAEPRPALISNSAARAVIVQLARLSSIHEGRRRIASHYAELLPEHAELSFPQFQPGRYLSRILIRLPEMVSARTLQNDLRSRRVRTRLGYPDWAGSQRDNNRELIELPMRIGMSRQDVVMVCRSLDDALKCGPRSPAALQSDEVQEGRHAARTSR